MRPGDEALHALLDRGDLRDAGTWLVEGYAHEVLGLCAAMVRDRVAAEDLAQDVFSRAFSGLDDYRREASSRTWLLAIARNRCIDHLRSSGRTPFVDAEPDEAPDEAPLPSDLLARRADVSRALAELGEGERALVVLRYRHGLSYKELANVFGLEAGATRMRVSRALGRMRAALEEKATPSRLEYAASGEVAQPEELRSPGRAAAAPEPLGYAAASTGEQATRVEEETDDRATTPPLQGGPAPASAPARRRQETPRARPSALSRLFGGEKITEQKASEAPPGAPPPPRRGAGGPPLPPTAPPPESASAENTLAAFLRAVDPTAPESFTRRLFDLAARL